MLSRYGEPGELLALPQRNSARRAVIRALAQSYRVLRARKAPEAQGALALLALLLERTLLRYAEAYRADSNAVLLALARACRRRAKVIISAVRTRLRTQRRGVQRLEAGEQEAFALLGPLWGAQSGPGDPAARRRLIFAWSRLTAEEQDLAIRAWVDGENQADIAETLGLSHGAIRMKLQRLKDKIRTFFLGAP